MRRALALMLLLVCGLVVPVSAQSGDLPDYLIRSLFCGLEAGQVVVRFDVVNGGGAAQEPAEVVTSATGSGPLATQQIAPLAAGARQPVELSFPSNLANGPLRLRTTVTLGVADSPAGSRQSQSANCAVNVPAQSTSAAIATAVPASDADWSFGLDIAPETIAVVVLALCCALLIMVGSIFVVVRLFSRSEPVFPVWQPPYVPQAMLNPASVVGARAGWQEHAASDALPSPCLPFDHASRKVLLGMDGVKLRNWRIEALRAVQYDMYGRVGRTQIVASKRLVRGLNKELQRAQPRPGKAPHKPEAIIQRLRPQAAWLANRLLRSTAKTPGLPIALDIRLTGDHGTVRILFELYACADGGWGLVDSWEPEMMLRGGVIAENFSYTFYGRGPDESKRALRSRLREDIALRLGLMMAQPQPPPAVESGHAPGIEEPPVPAGSTSPSAPVQFDHPTPPPTQEIPRVPDAPPPPATGPDANDLT